MINIKDIAHDVARDNPDLGDKSALERALASAFGIILERVASGENVHIHKFGSFKTQLFKGRTLNSPLMSGGSVVIKDQFVLRFHQAPVAKRKINELCAAGKAPKKSSRAKPDAESEPAPKAKRKKAKKGAGAAAKPRPVKASKRAKKRTKAAA